MKAVLIILAVLLLAGCGGTRRNSSRIARANALCRTQDARIAALESKLSGNYSYATIQAIRHEAAELHELGLDIPLTQSNIDVGNAERAILPGGAGPGEAAVELQAARRAAYAHGIHCSYGASG